MSPQGIELASVREQVPVQHRAAPKRDELGERQAAEFDVRANVVETLDVETRDAGSSASAFGLWTSEPTVSSGPDYRGDSGSFKLKKLRCVLASNLCSIGLANWTAVEPRRGFLGAFVWVVG